MLYKILSFMIFIVYSAQVNAGISESKELQVMTTLAEVVKPTGIFMSIILFIIVWAVLKVVKSIVQDLSDVFAEKRLLLQKALVFFQFIVYFSAVSTAVLLSFEFSKELLAILGGTLAVAVGFAMKDIAASIVAGIIIMFDRPFQVGDRVLFSGEYGDITAIGLRSVKMNTLDDNVITIPNNKFLNELTSCGNYGELDMQVAIHFYIGVDEDLQLAQNIIREAATLSKYVYLKKPINVLVSQVLTTNFVTYKLTLKVYVLDTKYEKPLETDITLRVNEQLKKQKVALPTMTVKNIQSESLENL